MVSLLCTPSNHCSSPTCSSLVPLFCNNPYSVAIVAMHGMYVILKATELVSPAQFPVLTLDQPL